MRNGRRIPPRNLSRMEHCRIRRFPCHGGSNRGAAQEETLSQSIVTNGQSLPQQWSNSFHCAVANFSIIFYPDPLQGLKQVYRCLKPGTGRVALTAWGNPEETPAFQIFPDVFHEFVQEDSGTSQQRPSSSRINGSVALLTDLLSNAGFIDIEISDRPVFRTLSVSSPEEYYDRFALTSPPTADRLSRMSLERRGDFRERVMELVNERGGVSSSRVGGDTSLALEAGAYLAYGRKPEEGAST